MPDKNGNRIHQRNVFVLNVFCSFTMIWYLKANLRQRKKKGLLASKCDWYFYDITDIFMNAIFYECCLFRTFHLADFTENAIQFIVIAYILWLFLHFDLISTFLQFDRSDKASHFKLRIVERTRFLLSTSSLPVWLCYVLGNWELENWERNRFVQNHPLFFSRFLNINNSSSSSNNNDNNNYSYSSISLCNTWLYVTPKQWTLRYNVLVGNDQETVVIWGYSFNVKICNFQAFICYFNKKIKDKLNK